MFKPGDTVVGRETSLSSSSETSFIKIENVGHKKYTARILPVTEGECKTVEYVTYTEVKPNFEDTLFGGKRIYIPILNRTRKNSNISSTTYNEIYDPETTYINVLDSWR